MSRQDYAERIAEIGHSLGIPASYGAGRQLRPQAEAGELVAVGLDPGGREVRLEPATAAAWTAMHTAAGRDGVILIPLSGYRSVARQTEIIRTKLDAGQDIEAILRVMSAPGYSEHHTGRAIDIGAPEGPPLTEAFAQTSAFCWLEAQAKKSGFHLSYPPGNPHGISFEPWHWCHRKG